MLAVAFDRARGQCDDRDVTAGVRLSFTDFGGRLEAIHHRHLAIHENQPELTGRMAFERFPAVHRGLDLAAETFKDPDGDFEIDRVILDQQYRRSCDPRR